ncbi:MAG: hypothetical protein R3A48_11265 [Polyangiales bacterium]
MSPVKSLVFLLSLAACTPTASVNLGGFADVPVASDTPALTDAGAQGDAIVLVDVASLADAVVAEDAPADATGPLLAWGQACALPTDRCAAPAGERGICSTARGTPLCMHTCDTQAANTLCEGDRGVCVAGSDGSKYCLPRCDESTPCAPGAACAWLGYRQRPGADAGLAGIGVCLASCTASGPDACMSPGSACNPTNRACERTDCDGMCPAGTACNNGLCNPPTPAALYTACNPAPGAPVVCSQNYCLGDSAQNSGFCTQACDSASGTLTCGTGVCYYGLNAAQTEMGAAYTGYWESSFNVLGGRLTGVCMKACATSADCPGRFSCQTYNGVRACIPYGIPDVTTSAGAGLPGTVCRANTDCATGNCLLFQGFRDGLCARASLTTPCPAGTSALSTSGGETLACARACASSRDADCPGSWRCTAQSLCANVGCRSNADCAAGYTCDVASDRCLLSPLPGAGEVGAPCASNEACRGGTCFTPMVNGGVAQWRDGYCTAGCAALAGGGDTCPAGSYCSSRSVGVQGACIKLCDAMTSASRFGACRAGYSCQAFTGDPRTGLCLN